MPVICINLKVGGHMARVDRSEEWYAKIAAIPPWRRFLYNCIAAAPVFVFVAAFYVQAASCNAGAVIAYTIIANSFAIAGSIIWLVVSHPRLPRKYSALSPSKRLMVIFCAAAIGIVLKLVLASAASNVDRLQAHRCLRQKPTQDATFSSGV
ncbi:hypothetical protein [Beijerinckia sp. L45]|uniref:hypothetical protein n=1 Tax=Beijerinckia sp. L45 TaxID=1641855 RepID=UPI00131CCD1E|nr:hypothetical protein [Beijerinckia sp. L45]